MHALARTLLAALAALAAPAFAGAPVDADNPLLAPSPLPLHYPRFDRIRDEHVVPALERGMAEQRRLVEAIAADPAAPSVANTLVALERSGALLDRVQRVVNNLLASNSNPGLQAAQREMAPRLAAHKDAILLDARLNARVDALWKRRASLGLDADDARLVELWHRDFVRAGAALDEPAKARLRAIDEELAAQETRFTQNVLEEREASAVVFDAEAELQGMSPAEIASAADAAAKAGKPGKYLVELVNTTSQPLLATLQLHASREKLMAASLARGSRGGEFDNRAVVTRMASLRAERARLLGYPDFAAFALADQVAGDAAHVNALLEQVARPAIARVRGEAQVLAGAMRADGAGSDFGAADWPIYAPKAPPPLSAAVDESRLRPFYELDHVLVDGVFYAASREYGLAFKERHDLPVYDPGVRVFDVFDADGSQLAIFVADYYARPNKNGGAWMSSYVVQSALSGERPVIVNNLNIPRPPLGEPTLLTQDEVTAAFHEFGHALHGMLAHVKYPRLGSGFARDFVEYPSQFNEMWATWPEVVEHFARHYKTGEPLPPAWLAQAKLAGRAQRDYATVEYLAAAAIDQAWYQAGPEALPAAAEVGAFEAAALKKAGLDFAPVPPRYRSTYFSHIFGNTYGAGYYAYLWSEVLAADSEAWIRSHGGLTRANGDRYRALVLSRGTSAEPLQLFREFTGAEPDVGPLVERRGLAPDAQPSRQPPSLSAPAASAAK